MGKTNSIFYWAGFTWDKYAAILNRFNAKMVGVLCERQPSRLIRSLFRIQLDDELLVDSLRNLVALRISEEYTRHFIRIPLQPSELANIVCLGAVT